MNKIFWFSLSFLLISNTSYAGADISRLPAWLQYPLLALSGLFWIFGLYLLVSEVVKKQKNKKQSDD
ncbi:hypothetical protein B0182_12025 [Moraxella bovis]|nr:hypothetical protein DQF64_08280 [Moraxella bovis]OOR87578.1 hypothetical protein B0182_12025 [Moraxella bovis]